MLLEMQRLQSVIMARNDSHSKKLLANIKKKQKTDSAFEEILNAELAKRGIVDGNICRWK